MATDLETQKEVAIKTEKINCSYPLVNMEAFIMRKISDVGIPEYVACGTDRNHGINYLVSQILGPSLSDMFKFCGEKFSLKTTILLFAQMFKLVRNLHAKNYMHRDLKPENFLMGMGKNSG